MKLTEQQLADIFSNSTKNHKQTGDLADCLQTLPASATRLSEAEKVLNDHNSAQSMKMAFGFKQWSEVVADSVKASQQSWFSILGMKTPFKTAVATVAFAFAFVVALPQFKDSQPIMAPTQIEYANDVINAVPFESNDQNDVLSNNSFDSGDKIQDKLFGASFG